MVAGVGDEKLPNIRDVLQDGSRTMFEPSNMRLFEVGVNANVNDLPESSSTSGELREYTPKDILEEARK